MHILIVDDEPLARQRLQRLIEALPDYTVVGEAANGDEAIEATLRLDPDIVLTDIRMPGKDGLEAAHMISAMEDPPALIFCTAYDEYALQAFETLAAGYLLKPVKEEQLRAALEKVTRTTKVQKSALKQVEEGASRQHIAAKTRRGTELIPIEDIYCFIADQKYVTVYHAEGETLIDDTLKELEEEFAQRFVRIHRNALVAIKGIVGMEKTAEGQYAVCIKDSEYRPLVSRRHLSGVRDLLNRL